MTTQEKFTILHCSGNCCQKGFDNLDKEPSNQDCELCGDRGDPCGDCLLCLSPLGLVIDILSCPCRCIHHFCKKQKKQKQQEEKFQSVINIQPYLL